MDWMDDVTWGIPARGFCSGERMGIRIREQVMVNRLPGSGGDQRP